MGKKGYIHVYTGNGKGKTTAAIGLAVRAACSGMNVYIGQFIKGMRYEEVKVCNYVKNIAIEQYGEDCFINKDPTEEDVKRAHQGLEKIANILQSNDFQLVVLDEILIAIYLNLITTEELIEVLDKRNPSIEVVLTGRYANEKIIDYADLVTEMREIKHYYRKGVLSRKGIDH